VEELLRIARESPLTDLIERNLPTTGRVLEAGWWLGQYVLLLPGSAAASRWAPTGA
jgi:hypothetical protein